MSVKMIAASAAILGVLGASTFVAPAVSNATVQAVSGPSVAEHAPLPTWGCWNGPFLRVGTCGGWGGGWMPPPPPPMWGPPPPPPFWGPPPPPPPFFGGGFCGC